MVQKNKVTTEMIAAGVESIIDQERLFGLRQAEEAVKKVYLAMTAARSEKIKKSDRMVKAFFGIIDPSQVEGVRRVRLDADTYGLEICLMSGTVLALKCGSDEDMQSAMFDLVKVELGMKEPV